MSSGLASGGLCPKVSTALFSATSVSTVSLWCGFTRNLSTTETQRHGGCTEKSQEQGLFVQSYQEVTNEGG